MKNVFWLTAGCLVAVWLAYAAATQEQVAPAQELIMGQVVPAQEKAEQFVQPVQAFIPPGAALTQEQLETFAALPARNGNEQIQALMSSLFQEGTIAVNGRMVKYRLHTPDKAEPNKKYPLVLWLHGAGENGTDNQKNLIHLHHILPYLLGDKKRDFFLLVPQTEGGWYARYETVHAVSKRSIQQYLDAPDKQQESIKAVVRTTLGLEQNTSFEVTLQGDVALIRAVAVTDNSSLSTAFAIVDQVSKSFPVDTDRITVSGLSTGGDGTWRALEARPDLFAAAVPLVSWNALRDDAIEASPVLKKIPIWAIYSSDDNGIDRARADFERVEKAGCNVKKSEFGICGHNAWTPAMLQADVFSWLLSRAKKDGEYAAVADANVNPDDLKGIVEVATRDPGKPKLAPAPPARITPTTGSAVPPAVVPQSAGDTTVPAGIVDKTILALKNRELDKKVSQSVQTPHSVSKTQTILESRRFENGKLMDITRHEIPVGALTAGGDVRTAWGGSAITPGTAASHTASPITTERSDELYSEIAKRYYANPNSAEELFERTFAKLSQEAQLRLALRLVVECRQISPERLQNLERMVDQTMLQVGRSGGLASPRAAAVVPQTEFRLAPRAAVAESQQQCAPPEKIIEDCDRPWAMSSDSHYGLFPADWNKEVQAVPDFAVSLNSDELAKRLARSVSNDGSEFAAVCQSLISLQHKPMSSPWFTTGGGRLQGEIRYTLSPKGEMLVRLLKTLKDSTDTAEKKARAALAGKTLEKIELITAEVQRQ
ncbi:MAG: hypothetical protein LBT46_06610 [Planctomycetaceae bacterium]|jgi:predicted peptidase|nr:hypothetical protein [Planctomycetaceae bacterium]